jgi:hypothetical protein
MWILIPLQIKTRESADVMVDARFVPKIAVALIFIFSVILILTSLILKKDKVVCINLIKEGKMLLFYLLMVGYVAAMPLIGFLFSSLLFGNAALLYLRSNKWQHYVIVSAVIALVHLVFVTILQVPLP